MSDLNFWPLSAKKMRPSALALTKRTLHPTGSPATQTRPQHDPLPDTVREVREGGVRKKKTQINSHPLTDNDIIFHYIQ